MSKSLITAQVLDGDRLVCQVVSPRGMKLNLIVSSADPAPEVDGSAALQGNRALMTNAWAYAKFTHLKVSLPSQHEQES